MSAEPTPTLVYCADDDPEVRCLFQRLISDGQRTVQTFADGTELLAAFQERAADIVLVDLDMPGTDGLSTCLEIRKQPDGYDVPIMIVSGIDDMDVIYDALDKGADDYILKPFSRAEILAKMAFQVRKRNRRMSFDIGLRPGSRFAGRYDVVREIGSGGFSMVLQARDLEAGRDVALKIFENSLVQRGKRELMQAFLREAYQLSRVDCSTIVKLFDFGQSGGFPYLAMEYLEGQSLVDIVQTSGPMPERDTCVVGREISRALNYLGERAMVHRDVKPSNIRITQEGRVKLLDFGLAKVVGDLTIARPRETFLSPAFAPPEAFLDTHEPDAEGDIFSLGATLYFIACAHPPYPGETYAEIMAARESGKHPVPMHKRVPTLSRALADLVMQALAPDPEQRPRATELKSRMDLLLGHL